MNLREVLVRAEEGNLNKETAAFIAEKASDMLAQRP